MEPEGRQVTFPVLQLERSAAMHGVWIGLTPKHMPLSPLLLYVDTRKGLCYVKFISILIIWKNIHITS